MNLKKKEIKVAYVGWGWSEDEDFLAKTLKKYYDVQVSEHPDFIFFSNKPPKDNPNLKGALLKTPIVKRYASKIKQTMCRLPFVGRLVYDYFNDIPKMRILNTKAKRIYFTCEPGKADLNNCETAFTFNYDEEIKNPKHYRLPYYFFCGAGKNLIKNFRDIEKIINEKKKFCAFVYSNNVPFRNKFFKMLSKYKKVDAPGDSMRNMPPFGRQKTAKERFKPDKSRGDWQKEKIDFLKDYKFVIAFENTEYAGYTTEKIYHPMLTNAIPIYWGNPQVDRDFNTKSFVNYYDFEKEILKSVPKFLLKTPFLKGMVKRIIVEPLALRKMIKRIIEIDQNTELYKKYLLEPWYQDNKVSIYADEQRFKKKLKEIFG